MKYNVYIEKCETYEGDRLKEAMERLLSCGLLDFIDPEERVYIKVNLVSGMRPERAATTHPAAVCALCDILCGLGCKDIVVGDSPGGLYSAAYVEHIYRVSGMTEVERHGAGLNRDFSVEAQRYEGARVLRDFTYTGYLKGQRQMINFCKLKSHGMMGMSAAAKNMFGVIPGTTKPEYHYRFPEYERFADMIVDIDEFFSPGLSIVDAIEGMEGNGPTAGTPRHMGFLAASSSPHMLDSVCADILGIDRDALPILKAAIARGLVPDEVTVSEDISKYRVEDFKYPRSHSGLQFQGKSGGAWRARLLGGMLDSKPRVAKNECIGCAVCAKVCPARAIEMKDGKPRIDREGCIRCFCCQEFCPRGAMKVHRPIVARIASKL